MIELQKINTALPDATFDLDGTLFKMNILETLTDWLSKESVIDSLPTEIKSAKEAWKRDNTEQNYNAYLSALVRFFVEQIPGKEVGTLDAAATFVASQQKHRRWGITADIIEHLQKTHNTIAVSLMPEWLMEPFTRDLSFVALIGSTYVTRDGLFTNEAYAINKADEYAKLRGGDVNKLDIHMGDTIGDKSLLSLARRPICFNPSYTLSSDEECKNMTSIMSHKDVVTVINPGKDTHHKEASVWGPPFDIPEILKEVRVTRS